MVMIVCLCAPCAPTKQRGVFVKNKAVLIALPIGHPDIWKHMHNLLCKGQNTCPCVCNWVAHRYKHAMCAGVCVPWQQRSSGLALVHRWACQSCASHKTCKVYGMSDHCKRAKAIHMANSSYLVKPRPSSLITIQHPGSKWSSCS